MTTTDPQIIAGTHAANKFIADLSTIIMIGDDLYHFINKHAEPVSADSGAWLRGFCRRIQKELEARA